MAESRTPLGESRGVDGVVDRAARAVALEGRARRRRADRRSRLAGERVHAVLRVALPDDRPPRMLLRDPHLQRHVGDLRVDLGSADAAVAEEALDVADVDAFLEQVRRYGMTEHVRHHALADGAALAVRAHEAADQLRGGGGAAGVDQERLGLARTAVARDAVAAQQRLDLLGDEDAALAVAFADDRDRPLLEVDRGVEQRRELAHAHARGEEDLRGHVRGEVVERRGAVVAEEAAQVRARDHARQTLRHADADARAAERVLDLAAILLEPAEERAQRGQVALHRRLLQRADVEEVADVVVDLGAVARGDGGAAPEELRGAREVELVRAHRVRRELANRPAVPDERGRRLAELHHGVDVIRQRVPTATGINDIWSTCWRFAIRDSGRRPIRESRIPNRDSSKRQPDESLRPAHGHVDRAAQIAPRDVDVEAKVVVRGADAEPAQRAILEARAAGQGAAGVAADRDARQRRDRGVGEESIAQRDAALHAGERDRHARARSLIRRDGEVGALRDDARIERQPRGAEGDAEAVARAAPRPVGVRRAPVLQIEAGGHERVDRIGLIAEDEVALDLLEAAARRREVRAGQLVPRERLPLEREALQVLGGRQAEVALEADARALTGCVRIETNISREVPAVAAAADVDARKERRLLRERDGGDEQEEEDRKS